MLMISIMDIDKKAQHHHAHRLLRECLRPYGVPEEAAIERMEYGKPYLRDFPELHFNLSHGSGIAACIVTDTECGIDCEQCREMREGVVRRCFSPAEKRLLEETPESERDLMFTRLWTLKEAFVKCIGKGIGYPMDTAEFAFEGSRIVTALKGYRFSQYILRGGRYVCSTAVSSR